MSLQDQFAAAAEPLPAIDSPAFAAHFDRFAHNRVILLGDSSHGTSEFYAARAAITKRLIERHGFTMVALEADWPDVEVIDRYVRQRPGPAACIGGNPRSSMSSMSSSSMSSIGGMSQTGVEPFNRFPTWMWRNREMQELVEWMRDRNAHVPEAQQAGIYGLDLYSMGVSIRAVIDYLDRLDPGMAAVARARYGCLQPWVEAPHEYGLAVMRGAMADCEANVVAMLRDLLAWRLEYSMRGVRGHEEFHGAEQNAYLVRDAERYYKALYYSTAGSWTLRDTHMADTLGRLLRFYSGGSGSGSGRAKKAVVWAHNSHCGDARYTSMGVRRGEVNIGQLCRQWFGRDQVALLGCGMHTGRVAAAQEWGQDMRVMRVKPSRKDSWERIAHDTGIPRFLLDLRRGVIHPGLQAALQREQPRLERFIGVIYRPETERVSHYSEADLLNQFDGYIWFDRTEPVKPLEVIQPATPLGREETYPFGE